VAPQAAEAAAGGGEEADANATQVQQPDELELELAPEIAPEVGGEGAACGVGGEGGEEDTGHDGMAGAETQVYY